MANLAVTIECKLPGDFADMLNGISKTLDVSIQALTAIAAESDPAQIKALAENGLARIRVTSDEALNKILGRHAEANAAH